MSTIFIQLIMLLTASVGHANPLKSVELFATIKFPKYRHTIEFAPMPTDFRVVSARRIRSELNGLLSTQAALELKIQDAAGQPDKLTVPGEVLARHGMSFHDFLYLIEDPANTLAVWRAERPSMIWFGDPVDDFEFQPSCDFGLTLPRGQRKRD